MFNSRPVFIFVSEDETTASQDTPGEFALAPHLLPAMTIFHPSLMSKFPQEIGYKDS